MVTVLRRRPLLNDNRFGERDDLGAYFFERLKSAHPPAVRKAKNMKIPMKAGLVALDIGLNSVSTDLYGSHKSRVTAWIVPSALTKKSTVYH